MIRVRRPHPLSIQVTTHRSELRIIDFTTIVTLFQKVFEHPNAVVRPGLGIRHKACQLPGVEC